MKDLWLVSAGGGLGAICRYLVGLLMMRWFPHPPIPVAMLVVNVLGSFGLGLLMGRYLQTVVVPNDQGALFSFLGVGFFGAFTTFSTFSVEAMQLLRDQKVKQAFLYVALSLVGSVVAFIAGFYFVAV